MNETRNIIYTVDVNTGKAVQGVNELESEVSSLQTQLQGAKETGQKFADLLEFGAGLTGGIAAFQGVVTLAGVENDKLTESLTRLMAIQTTLSGLQQTANLFRSENIFLTKSLITWIKAKNVVMQKSKLLTAGIVGGLGALVVAIGLGIREFNKFHNELEKTPEYEDSAWGKFITKATKEIEEFPQTLKGAWTAFTTFMSGGTLEEARKAGDKAFEQSKKLKAVTKEIEKFRNESKANAELRIKRMELEGATEEQIFKAKKKIIETEMKLLNKLRNTEGANRKEVSREMVELDIQRKQLAKEYTQFLTDERNKREEERKADFEKRKERARTEYEELKEILDEINAQETQDEKIRIGRQVNEVEQTRYNTWLEWSNKQAQEQEKKDAEELRKAKELEQKKQAIRQFAIAQVNNTLGVIENMQEIAMNNELKAVEGNEEEMERIRKEYFEKNKQIQVARALMSTYESAVNAYNAMVGIPGVGPVLGPIAAAGAIAFGLSNVEKIKAQQYTGGASGPTSTQDTNSFGSPTLDASDAIDFEDTTPDVIVPQGGSSERTESGSGQRVYVLESDIRNTMNDVAFVSEVSTL